MEQQQNPEASAYHPRRDDNASSSSHNGDPQVLSPISTNTAVQKDVALLPETHEVTAESPPAPRAGLKGRLQLSANRLLSLDLLRGLAILVMITCNAQMDGAFWILCEFLYNVCCKIRTGAE